MQTQAGQHTRHSWLCIEPGHMTAASCWSPVQCRDQGMQKHAMAVGLRPSQVYNVTDAQRSDSTAASDGCTFPDAPSRVVTVPGQLEEAQGFFPSCSTLLQTSQ